MNFTDIQTALVTDTRNRIAIIAGIAVLTLGGNLLAMVLGTPESLLPLPTLPLTIPIIIASYWYPRRGIPPVSVCFASVYAVTTYFLSPPGPPCSRTPSSCARSSSSSSAAWLRFSRRNSGSPSSR
ncbi:hypothetical protein [Methanoculleus chikugoensis]|uniref:hypothetical protein n=1 Tax=Methanoculleus chikugoensis TaxID=118126 RepID=UPI000B245C1D|nr:hypothetical protein [Methanoculleus chikugoensis]